MTGGIEEGDPTAFGFDLVGADVLRDAAGFASGHVCIADPIEQAGFAVVDVTHDRDDRRTKLGRAFFSSRFFVEQAFFGKGDALALEAEFVGNEGGGVDVDGLVDRDHHAHREQLGDHLATLDGHLVRKLANGDQIGHFDDAFVRRGLGDLGLLALFARALLLAGVEPHVAAALTAITTTVAAGARRTTGAARTRPKGTGRAARDIDHPRTGEPVVDDLHFADRTTAGRARTAGTRGSEHAAFASEAGADRVGVDDARDVLGGRRTSCSRSGHRCRRRRGGRRCRCI